MDITTVIMTQNAIQRKEYGNKRDKICEDILTQDVQSHMKKAKCNQLIHEAPRVLTYCAEALDKNEILYLKSELSRITIENIHLKEMIKIQDTTDHVMITQENKILKDSNKTLQRKLDMLMQYMTDGETLPRIEECNKELNRMIKEMEELCKQN